ncbi:hypothetical protein AB4Y36_38040 [Paraburkholderia sp. BR10936]|uniref:phage neck terminator protein n=1 Tax=Paraburkholderia sp. BR10936 TaxID=3236993 RepID=UPI0034D31A05
MQLPSGDVRETWSGGPVGGRAFCTFCLESVIPLGPARTDFYGQSERERITVSVLETWVFEAYGNGADEFAEFARAAMQGESGQAMFRRERCALIDTRPSLDLTGLAGQQEHRSRFLATLSTVRIFETELEAIRLADLYVHTTMGADELVIEHVPVRPPDEP